MPRESLLTDVIRDIGSQSYFDFLSFAEGFFVSFQLIRM